MQNNKTTSPPKILKELEKIAQILPAPIYWEDINSVIIGGNEAVFNATGALKRDAYIGKTLYELYPKEMADNIKRHNELVMKTGKVLSQEESIEDITTGVVKYFTAVKAPLYDDDGNIIGIVGTSIDITAEKEAERLRVENEAHQVQLQEQEKFKTITNQVAHDIRSPIASLLMLVKSCQEIPESERISLREAAMSIGDIANSLLRHYRPKDKDIWPSKNEGRQSVLVSALLLQLLTDKKYQYQNKAVKFTHDFTQQGNFAFIKIEPSALKRSISNLINNAVDAFEDRDGVITVRLDAIKDWVQLTIQDNGKGMSPELIAKVMSNISVTEGKEDGHGLGLMQVRSTLERSNGELKIVSVLGKGTQVILKFPQIKAAAWLAESIQLGGGDIIIVLDDDSSIHGAWDAQFESVLQGAPDIELKHFKEGQKTLAFINSLAMKKKQKVFLLSDYELLNQGLNGLDVIEQSGVKRSLLVTSHYAHANIQERAVSLGTKILPKQLASDISIVVVDLLNDDLIKGRAEGLKVDLIIVDDDQTFANNLKDYIFSDRIVDCFYDPRVFLQEVIQYPKDTKICLDNTFHGASISGIELAEELHNIGYTKLYLLSGEAFKQDDLPSYLIPVLKTDLDLLQQI